MLGSTMNGKPYQVSRFATSLRRKLYRGLYDPPGVCRVETYTVYHFTTTEHLGLIEPQNPNGHHRITEFMRPAPYGNPDETNDSGDRLVADPLSDQTMSLWNSTAHRNREIFSDVFKTVPTNIVRNWKNYDVRPFSFLTLVLSFFIPYYYPLELCTQGQNRSCCTRYQPWPCQRWVESG